MAYFRTAPEKLNLLRRLNELPKAAMARVNPTTTGIPRIRFRHILYGKVQLLSDDEVSKFLKVLKCSEEEFFNPEYIFMDFRTQKEILEDLAILIA